MLVIRADDGESYESKLTLLDVEQSVVLPKPIWRCPSKALSPFLNRFTGLGRLSKHTYPKSRALMRTPSYASSLMARSCGTRT